ncbi:MAG TPA: 7-carboxy-7-deazaguanine synthase, partial [Hyphomicrobiales bacterium]|nr:7-carboxy-7-deazaguanine synthase [Hyphomicrobiales bacterium]
VFLRFAGCNLWSGLERDRERAICQFCDTDFVGTNGPAGGKFVDAEMLAEAVALQWQESSGETSPSEERGGRRAPGDGPIAAGRPYVVCTGGEPLLQLDAPLIEALHARGFEVAIETNGTITAPPGIDWICVSPKARTELALTKGDELKLVFPQEGAEPPLFEHLDFRHFFLQPMDGPYRRANIEAAARYCLSHPLWRLSLQTHKFIGLP